MISMNTLVTLKLERPTMKGSELEILKPNIKGLGTIYWWRRRPI